MTAFQFREWWRYRRNAQGRHGVHSPFVYRFVEEGLQPGIPKDVRRDLSALRAGAHEYAEAKTLFCCLKFLKPGLLQCIGMDNRLPLLEAIVKHAGVKLAKENQAAIPDCILLGDADAAQIEHTFATNAARMKDGLVFIVAGIHASPHHALQWLRLREDERVNLSIDLWHVGLLFYRADFKERQHFVLKFPA